MSEPVNVGVSISTAPRKVYDTRDDDRTAGIHGDCDDDKYRRRPALGWLAQLLRYTETQGWDVRKEKPHYGQSDDSGTCSGAIVRPWLDRQVYCVVYSQGLCPFLL